MFGSMNRLVIVIVWFTVFLSFDKRNNGEIDNLSSSISFHSISDSKHTYTIRCSTSLLLTELDFDFNGHTHKKTEEIQSSKRSPSYSDDPSHDCFIHGCDAFNLSDAASSANNTHKTEKQVIANSTLKHCQDLETACSGVVSCADMRVLAARNGIVLAGGPFNSDVTGQQDNVQSFFEEPEPLEQLSIPDGNKSSQAFCFFAFQGLDGRDTVSVSGAHNTRIFNISHNGVSSPSHRLRNLFETILGMAYYQGWSAASMSSGAGYKTHYTRSLLRGSGPLFVDQQVIADEATESLVRTSAFKDGSIFRTDFRHAIVKLFNLDVPTWRWWSGSAKLIFACLL